MSVSTAARIEVFHVTLFEDRAHVVRRGRVALPAGRVHLRVPDVAPVLADRTLRCRVRSGPPGIALVEARALRARQICAADRPAAVQERDLLARALGEEATASDERLAALDQDLAALAAMRAQTLADVAQDAAWGRDATSEWREHLTRLGTDERAARAEAVALAVARAGLERRARDLAELDRARARPADAVACVLELVLEVPAAGEAELECAYTVPGACWRPAHTAERRGDGLKVTSEACVWQNTGEDWRGVALSFSTQRLSRGVEPPALETDLLTVQRRRRTVVVQTREQPSARPGEGAAAAPQEVPGIDDGGETRHLEAPARANVPSDGRPHRVPLWSFETDVRTEHVVAGELQLAVHVKTEQVNASPYSLLAGPVDLVGESGWLGRAAIAFVAPGERFVLGWGCDASLRVRRTHEDAVDEGSLLDALSPWTTRDHRVVVKLSNVGVTERQVTVTERVPVSEIEKVQVVPEPDDTTDGQRPDRDGFLRWQVPILPNGQVTVRMRYRVSTHRDVAG